MQSYAEHFTSGGRSFTIRVEQQNPEWYGESEPAHLWTLVIENVRIDVDNLRALKQVLDTRCEGWEVAVCAKPRQFVSMICLVVHVGRVILDSDDAQSFMEELFGAASDEIHDPVCKSGSIYFWALRAPRGEKASLSQYELHLSQLALEKIRTLESGK